MFGNLGVLGSVSGFGNMTRYMKMAVMCGIYIKTRETLTRATYRITPLRNILSCLITMGKKINKKISRVCDKYGDEVIIQALQSSKSFR